jgi:hypothetical protein
MQFGGAVHAWKTATWITFVSDRIFSSVAREEGEFRDLPGTMAKPSSVALPVTVGTAADLSMLGILPEYGAPGDSPRPAFSDLRRIFVVITTKKRRAGGDEARRVGTEKRVAPWERVR